MAVVSQLLTAEQFANLPDPGYPQELVRGVVFDMPPAKPRHGKICARILQLLQNFADEQDLGHVLGHDTGVVTERSPDTVRGADVSFYSYAKVPQGPLPDHYLTVPPDAVFEVLSPSDRWVEVHRKVAEYLTAGIAVVYVVEPELQRVQAFFIDEPVQAFGHHDEFCGTGPLADWKLPVSKFFA